MLQETHSTEFEKQKWNEDWNSKMLFNHGTSNSKGTLIAFSKNLDYKIIKYDDDKDGRIQICSILIDGKKKLIVNIYNENIESKQIILLKKLNCLLENFNSLLDHAIILGGDWNFIFDKHLDASGGNPQLKLSSIAEITKLIEKYDLCNIFRIRNPDTLRYYFRQPTPKKLRRLDFFLTSNSLQDRIESCNILTSIASDHSPVCLNFGSENSYHP